MMEGAPVILVDMDGPLADFDMMFFDEVLARGWEIDCTPEKQRHRFATDHMPNRHERNAARQMVNDEGWFRHLPVTPGAYDGLHMLADYGDVWVCSKPLEANPTCRDDKARWLAEHFGSQWMRKLILAPDKSLVHGDVLLDDAIKLRWLDNPHRTWEPVCFKSPFNGHSESEWLHLPQWTWGEPIERLLWWLA